MQEMRNHNVAAPAQRPIVRTAPAIGGVLLATLAASAGPALTDGNVTLAVKTALTVDEATPHHLIDVEAEEGIVMLSGYVHSLRAADRARRVAETVKGVRGVVNRLNVRTENRPDGQIKADVEAGLDADPATEPKDVNVNVDNGIVTLTGAVESWPVKRLCGTVVRGVRGVRGLVNELVVEHAKDRSDREIEAEVRRRIQAEVWVRDGDVDVTVQDGVVQVLGTVGSAAEKSRIEILAGVHGVRKVDVSGLKVNPEVLLDMRRTKRPGETSDEYLVRAVRAALDFDPRVDAAAVEVSADDHVVRLTGKVGSVRAKDSAETDALNVIGVWRVQNHLDVRTGGEPPPDSELKRRVEEALLRDPDVNRESLILRVRNGEIFLYGEVNSHYEREATINAVSQVNGVAAVTANGLTVYEPQQDQADEEIEEAIRSELWWSPFVDSENISVSVADGGATLLGTVSDVHERNLATSNAYEGGAEVVYNRLKIAEEE